MDLESWELLSYVVTVVGLPLAIAVFVYEQRRERDNEEDEVYQLLSDNYQDFLKTALEHSELRLFSAEQTPSLNEEQRERMLIIFSMLVSLFERAYLLLYEDHMNPRQLRLWQSAIMGGLHARMVSTRRFPCGSAGAVAWRECGVRGLSGRTRAPWAGLRSVLRRSAAKAMMSGETLRLVPVVLVPT